MSRFTIEVGPSPDDVDGDFVPDHPVTFEKRTYPDWREALRDFVEWARRMPPLAPVIDRVEGPPECAIRSELGR